MTAAFSQILLAAIAEISTQGYVSPDRIDFFATQLRNAAEQEMGAEQEIDIDTRYKLGAVFDKFVEKGRIVERVPGVSRFNVAMIRPSLRAELDRRVHAAASLIRLDRKAAIDRTIDRLRGWATSIPPGGDETIDKREVRSSIGKSVAEFKYEKRRVDIDQSHKLIANISEIVAVDAGAVAGIWHDHGENDRSYDARKEHMARAGKVFLVRDSWADRAGLVKPIDGTGYMDEIDRPGQAVYCRCRYQWITSPRRLPDAMLTRKGQEFVTRKAA